MNFSNSSIVEQLVWTMRLADYPRSVDRARINRLFNGSAPYTAEEVSANGIAVNVNDLTSTRLAHDARNQLYNSFMKPGAFFSAKVDRGPSHKRGDWSATVSSQVNRVMKRSMPYSEKMQCSFASMVLHGVGPSVWQDRDTWCPEARGIEDILLPSNTLRSLSNVPFFSVYESYTFWQLYSMTHGPKVDPGWNMEEVEGVLRWAYDQTATLLGTTWPEVWSPEKMEERIKQDSGFFAADAVPTINCWKFFFLDDSKGKSGWKMRIVLDSAGAPGVGGVSSYDGKTLGGNRSEGFLYSSGDRIYGSNISELAAFQFADLSAVSPFRYHSIRSLGHMLYAPCHLQNRMRCKNIEAVFENLMMYFRVHNKDEAERALKIDLISRGYIDDSIEFVKPQDRWQVNENLVQLGLQDLRSIIDENASSYVQNQNYSQNKVEKTKFQVMAEVNAMQTLISSALMLAYKSQEYEYREIFRRFCKKNSKDAEVREFRVNCLKAGVPESVLIPEAWDIDAERVMGAGSKTIELQAAQLLMQHRNLYDPASQRRILEKFTLATTDDPAETMALVPQQPAENPAVIKAQTVTGSLLQGVEVEVQDGIDLQPYIETLLIELAKQCDRILQTGGVPSDQRELAGLGNMGQHIGMAIQLFGQDETQKELAKKYSDALGKLMNELKGFSQRFMEQQQAEAAEAQAGDPAAAAKVQAQQQLSQIKAQTMAQTNQLKQQQSETQFQQKTQQSAALHQLEVQQKIEAAQADSMATGIKTAAEIERAHAVAEAAPKEQASE